MKIQIVNKNEEIIDGYYIISTDKLENISTVINNSCTDLIAVDVLDKLPQKDCIDLLTALMQKIRINGRIVISGVHLLSLAQGIINETIDQNTINDIICQSQSILDSRKICNILENQKFIIDTLKIYGYKYEIIAIRSSI